MNDNALKIEFILFFSGRMTHMLHVLICIRSYNITSKFVISIENRQIANKNSFEQFLEKDAYKNIVTVFLRKYFNNFEIIYTLFVCL